jgi:hypothetical protein
MSVSTRLTALSVMMLIVAAGLFIGIPAASQVASRGPVDNTDSEPNDDKANATVVDTDGTIEGQLLDSDHSDNYKVQLTNDGANADKITINIVFDEDLPLVSVYLRDSNGFLLEFMRDTKNTNMYAIGTSASAWYHLNITDDLQTGIYYNVTFTFTVVTFTGNGDSNNDPTEAVVIPSLPYHINTTADGDMDPYDHQDFYKVMLSRTLTKADLLVAHMTQAITAQFWVEVFTEGYVNVDAFAKESDPRPAPIRPIPTGPTAQVTITYGSGPRTAPAATTSPSTRSRSTSTTTTTNRRTRPQSPSPTTTRPPSLATLARTWT